MNGSQNNTNEHVLIMRPLIAVFPLVLSVLSCTGKTDLFEESIMLGTRATSSDIVITDSEHTITAQKALHLLDKRFNNKNVISLDVLNESGKNLLYVANFESGWAIVAGDDRAENAILAYSYSDSFDLDNIDCPEVSLWLEMVKSNIMGLSNKEVKSQEEQRYGGLPDIDYNQPYYWVDWKETPDTLLTDVDVDHLMSTEWGQSFPWNEKCPQYDLTGNRCPAGCYAVAVGQILFYLRNTRNFPIEIHSHIAYSYPTPINDKYSIIVWRDPNSVFPDSWWTGMAKYWYESGTSNVASLLVDIGDSVEMAYSPTGSKPTRHSYIEVFSDYNVDYDYNSYSSSRAIDSINDDSPLLVIAAKNDSVSHAWVIDGYHYTTRRVDQPYQWRAVATDSLNYYYSEHLIRYYYTESQMQLMHPNVVEGDVFHEYYTISDINKYLRMNWGWNGSYNSGYYSFTPTDSSSYSSWQYSINPVILYNFEDLY